MFDRQTGSTQICSVSTTSVQGSRRSQTDLNRHGVTNDGRYVAFCTNSPEIDPSSKNGSWNAYIRDLTSKNTKRVSAAPSGVELGGGFSRHPSTTDDGRFVAFSSTGVNLVPGDTNDGEDVFLYDRKTKSIKIVSVNSLGSLANFGYWNGSREPDISADGSLVAFTSNSDNIVDGHSNQYSDIIVRNLVGNTNAMISSSKNNPSNGDSSNPRISKNNRYVVYTSRSTNILPGVQAGNSQIYQFDRNSGKTILISVNNLGQQGNGSSDLATQSGDGRYVAFQSNANNLVNGDTNNCADIFVRDTVLNVTTRVSLGNDGSQAVADCLRPWITPDGKKVAFDTIAGNLVPNDTNSAYDVFVRDLSANTTTRVSTSTGGGQVVGDSDTAFISNDGRYVTFGSWASTLVGNDLNNTRDLFRKDLLTGVTIMLDVNSAGIQGNNWVPSGNGPYMLSADGQTVTYTSLASNLVTGDANQDWDTLVADIKTDIGISQVSVTPGTIQSGDSTTLSVTLTSPAPTGGLVVNLQSNNSAATVPASITIPSGQTTGTATVTGGSPLVSTTVTLAASYGGSSKTVNVVVRPWLTSLTLSTGTVNGGTSLTGTIQLVAPASTGGVVVTLATSDATGATVPASIKIATGSDHVSFTIPTVLVTADKPVKITATSFGYSVSANLTVKAVGVSISISPRVTVGGGPNVTGIVAIGSPAGQGGLLVNLSSNSTSVSVPATVLVPAGKVKVGFSVSSISVSKPITATLTASLSAKVSASTTLSVNPIGPLSLQLFSSPTSSGTDVLAAVLLNAPAPAGGLTLTITSSDPSIAQPETTIFIPAGQTSGWFDISVPTRIATASATISVSANNLSASSILTVNP